MGLAQLSQIVLEVVRQHSIAEQAYYRWYEEYRGLGKSKVVRLKGLDRERFRKALEELA